MGKLTGLGVQTVPPSSAKPLNTGYASLSLGGGQKRSSKKPFTATEDERPLSGDNEMGATRPKK